MMMMMMMIMGVPVNDELSVYQSKIRHIIVR